jgi:hypothetical protein
MRPGRLELPRAIRPTRPSTLSRPCTWCPMLPGWLSRAIRLDVLEALRTPFVTSFVTPRSLCRARRRFRPGRVPRRQARTQGPRGRPRRLAQCRGLSREGRRATLVVRHDLRPGRAICSTRAERSIADADAAKSQSATGSHAGDGARRSNLARRLTRGRGQVARPADRSNRTARTAPAAVNGHGHRRGAGSGARGRPVGRRGGARSRTDRAASTPASTARCRSGTRRSSSCSSSSCARRPRHSAACCSSALKVATRHRGGRSPGSSRGQGIVAPNPLQVPTASPTSLATSPESPRFLRRRRQQSSH